MTEREMEHVRMVDAGRLLTAYASPLTTSGTTGNSKKLKFVEHKNKYGWTLIASAKGM